MHHWKLLIKLLKLKNQLNIKWNWLEAIFMLKFNLCKRLPRKEENKTKEKFLRFEQMLQN